MKMIINDADDFLFVWKRGNFLNVCKVHLLGEGRGVIPALDMQWGEEQDVQRGMWAAAMELDTLGVLQMLVQHR